MINHRRITFKNSLRDSTGDLLPSPMTPEHLIRGYNFVSVNLIQSLQPKIEPMSDPNFGGPFTFPKTQ